MRTIKIVGITVGSLVVLFVVFLLAVALLVNPNAYKQRIELAVKRATGRDLVLQGNLHLSVFPWIALRFGPASLGNPPGFPATPFLTLRQASLRVRLLPLLHGQLEVGRVRVEGLDAQLLRNTQGVGNWSFTTGATAGTTSQPAGTPSSQSALPEVAGLDLTDSRVSYERWQVENINLSVGHVAEGVPVPVSLRAQLLGGSSTQPLPFDAKFTLTQTPQALQLQDLALTLADSHLNGEVRVPSAASEPLTFDLTFQQLDLDQLQASTAQPASKGAAPSAGPSSSMTLPTDTLKTLNVDGTLSIGTLRVEGLTLTNVQTTAHAKDGIAQLAPLTAQLYGGQARGDIRIEAQGATPTLTLDQQLQGVNIAGLLGDFLHTTRLTGMGNLTAMLSARGADSSALLHTLDGHVSLDITHGAIQGINLTQVVQQAESLLRQGSPPSVGSGDTRFSAFHASADLQDGVATTKDLDIATQLARVSGTGTLNLLTEAVQYQLQVTLQKGAGAGTLAQIPLDVTGTLANLQVRPNLQQLAKSSLQQQLQKNGGQLQKKVEGALQGLFGHPSKPR